MLVYSSPAVQLTKLPLEVTSDNMQLLDLHLLVQTSKGIYFGPIGHTKQLTLHPSSKCLLRMGGDLVTVHSDHLATMNSRIPCEFQPTNILFPKHKYFFYSTDGYFGQLINNCINKHLLPHTILKKPITCAGYNQDEVLLVSGHQLYLIQNDIVKQKKLDSGVFGICNNHSKWVFVSIIDQFYALLFADKELNIVDSQLLPISDKHTLHGVYYLNGQYVCIFDTVLWMSNHQLHLPSTVVCVSPIVDRDNQIRFVMQDDCLYTISVGIESPIDAQAQLLNHLAFGWLPPVIDHIQDMDEFLKWMTRYSSIDFQIEALHRTIKHYGIIKMQCPIQLYNAYLYKAVGYLLLQAEPQFIQQCCTTGTREQFKLRIELSFDQLPLFKGIHDYLHSPQHYAYGLELFHNVLQLVIDTFKVDTLGLPPVLDEQFFSCLNKVNDDLCFHCALVLSQYHVIEPFQGVLRFTEKRLDLLIQYPSIKVYSHILTKDLCKALYEHHPHVTAVAAANKQCGEWLLQCDDIIPFCTEQQWVDILTLLYLKEQDYFKAFMYCTKTLDQLDLLFGYSLNKLTVKQHRVTMQTSQFEYKVFTPHVDVVMHLLLARYD